MDKQTRAEIQGRTLRLRAHEVNAERIDRLIAQLDALGRQTHERRLGVRVRISKRRRIAKGNALIDRAFRDGLDIREDAIDQIKLMAKALDV